MTRPLTIVTGGTRGIGRAVALRLAAEGHDLVLGYAADDEAAEATAAEIEALGAAVATVRADLSADPSPLLEKAAALGALTGLVHAAGAVASVGPLETADPALLRRDLEVNLLAPVLVARAAIPALRATGGAIVLLSSAAATLGGAGEYVHYAAAKAGVDALTVGLAKELAADGVRVNAVAPGTVWTDFHQDPERPAKVAARIPMGRAGRPEEIAGAVAWLLSPDAGYTTGAVLRVAGGL